MTRCGGKRFEKGLKKKKKKKETTYTPHLPASKFVYKSKCIYIKRDLE